MAEPRIAVLLSLSGQGGVERMVLNLVEAVAADGRELDLLVIKASNLPALELPQGVRLVDLGARHSSTALWPLTRYLRRYRPTALLAAKDRAIRTAVLASRLAGTRTRIVGRLGTNLSAALQGRGAVSRWLRLAPMRGLYRHVDQVVAVSQGVARDTAAITGLPDSRIRVIPNPV